MTNILAFQNTLEALCWAHNQSGGTIHQFCDRYAIDWLSVTIRGGRETGKDRELFVDTPEGGRLVWPMTGEYRRGGKSYSCVSAIAAALRDVRAFAPLRT